MNIRIQQPTLFLDYDGVLHRGDSYDLPKQGIVSGAPGIIRLFEFAEILDEILMPYPMVHIVLSTDWVSRFGFARSRDSLPVQGLVQRVIGSTFTPGLDHEADWRELSRGAQVARYVQRHGLDKWLALDDRRDGFNPYVAHLVHCQTDVGLGDDAVVTLFKQRLRQHFGAAESQQFSS